jgi:ketosteroid isomerase-like protein
MPRQNVEIVRAVLERWGRGDFRPDPELVDPGMIFVLREGFPDAGTYSGTEEVAKYMQMIFEPWDRLTIEAEEIVEAGDGVLAAVRQRGVGVKSGIGTDFRYFQAWLVQGGRVIRLESCRDRSEALEAVGLSE